MTTKSVLSGLVALALSGASALATCASVSGVVECENGNSKCGIVVCVAGVGSTTTDSDGCYYLELPNLGCYTICVDPNSLPAGTSVSGCQKFTVDYCNPYACVDFCLYGSICCPPPPSPSRCWLTGGGTVGKTKGQPDYSYGGVVNPGCSPTAAGGGNWNVVDHKSGIHFKGQNIIVDDCFGAPTKSPKVDVRIIDFHGTGIVSGVAGNPLAVIPVTFVGRAVDNKDGGSNSDLLFISVTDGTTTWLQIGNSVDDMALISTGNLQIHTSGCNK